MRRERFLELRPETEETEPSKLLERMEVEEALNHTFRERNAFYSITSMLLRKLLTNILETLTRVVDPWSTKLSGS